MKKFLKSILATASLFPTTVLAIDVPKPSEAPGGDLPGIITTISNTILLLVGVIAVLFIIIGGFQYITSAGNPESINKAKQTIFYAVIGIIATLLAYVVVKFVIDQLT